VFIITYSLQHSSRSLKSSLYLGLRRLLVHITDNDAFEMTMTQTPADRMGTSEHLHLLPMSLLSVPAASVDSSALRVTIDLRCPLIYPLVDSPIIA
jgi:hypothetical protein